MVQDDLCWDLPLRLVYRPKVGVLLDGCFLLNKNLRAHAGVGIWVPVFSVSGLYPCY